MRISNIFNIFKRKHEEFPPMPEEMNEPLPEDLERFRYEREEPVKPAGYPEPSKSYESPGASYGGPIPELGPGNRSEKTAEPSFAGDKVDLILQKLDTIDTRLKLIEERTKR